MAGIPNQSRNWVLFEKSFSRSRMQLFLDKSSGSQELAQLLYVWNSKASASFWEVISYLEIAVRTVVDSQLTKASKQGNWLTDPAIIRPESQLQTLIRDANSQASRLRRNPTKQHVLEHLPLGFLQSLLSKRNLHLWPDLAAGFGGARRDQHAEICFLMARLRELRNAIGHHNHLLDLELEDEFKNLVKLAKLINPELGRWIKETSSVEEILAAQPEI